jgi:hypothetical protein
VFRLLHAGSRQLADYLRAISSYPSSQAMQAEASRIWHTALPW